MENFQLFLLILQVVIAVILVILVLLQKSDGDSLSGIGSGTGGLNSVISGKASANILSKTTMILIGIFMLNCLVLASISNSASKAIKNDLKEAAQQEEQNGTAQQPTQQNETPSIPQAPKVK